MRPRRVLFVFVDGVGLGPEDEATNVMVRHMPRLTTWLGTPPTAPARTEAGAAALCGLDATLGIDGLPQSGTGQATLLTGVNAAALHGRHFGPWVPTRLRALVRSRSILARARDAGRTVAFANAYPEEVLAPATDTPPSRRMPRYLHAGPPLAALGAGVLDRHTAHLERGNAVASEILNDGWQHRLGRTRVPTVTAAAAARNLTTIAARYDLTLFAHYSTDYAGHLRDFDAARHAITRFDDFLGELITTLPADMMLVVASDHGNLEDCTAGHTRNPALCILAGAGRADLAPPEQLTDIAPLILHALAVP